MIWSKRLLAIILTIGLLFPGAVPVLAVTISQPVHTGSCSVTNDPGFANPGPIATMVCQLPWVAGSGNVALVGTTGSGTINAPTDDKSDTFTQVGTTSSDATNGVNVKLYCAPLTAGAQKVTFNFSGNPNNNVTGVVAEFNDVTNCTADVANHHVQTGVGSGAQTITGGSATPTQTGDLIFEFMTLDTSTGGSCAAGTGNSNITWNLGAENTFQYSCWQWGQYNSTAALNPNFSVTSPGASQTYNASWVALKTSATGTAVSGMQAIAWFHQNSPSGTSVTPTLKFPVYGNTHVILHSVVNTCAWTAISSSPSLTWTELGSKVQVSQNIEIWYTKNDTSPSTAMTVSPTTTGGCNTTANEFTASMIDIQGAAANPIDTGFGTSGFASASGSASGAGDITTFTATPTNANEIVLVGGSQAADSATGVTTPSGAVFIQDVYTCSSGCASGGPSGYTVPTLADENDLWAIWTGSSVAAQTWTFSHDQSTNANVGNWADAGVALMAPAAASTLPQVFVIRP